MQFHRLQNIPICVQMGGNRSVLLCLCVCVWKNALAWKFERKQAGELTSSVSSPDRGFCCAAPRGAVWCPAALQSVSCTSSSAAAQSAAYLHYRPARQPAAETAITHTHSLLLIVWHISITPWFQRFLALLSKCLLLCCSVSSLSSNSCWSFFLPKSISRMARLYFIRHSPPGKKGVNVRIGQCDTCIAAFLYTQIFIQQKWCINMVSVFLNFLVSYKSIHRELQSSFWVSALT